MARYPRYLTFKDGELERLLLQAGIAPEGESSRSDNGGDSRKRRLKDVVERHSGAVTYPDGTTGVFHYQRCSDAWHVLRYVHLGHEGKSTYLPSQRITERLPNTVAAIEAIEAAAQNLADSAFQGGIDAERQFFQRASSPSGEKPTEKPQMKAKRAARLAGKYVLCHPLGPQGDNLLPISEAFDSLTAAIAAWEAQGNTALVIGCCHRFRRRWERPRYNPLHAKPDYGKQPTPVGGEEEAEEEELPMPGSDFLPDRERDEDEE